MITPFAILLSILAAALLAPLFLYIQFQFPLFHHGSGMIRNGPWATRFAVGGAEMDLKLRAVVAIVGLWALKSSETVYFSALTDSDGATLKVNKRYRIEGTDLDARWWALTVYKDHQFIPNRQYRYSYSHTNLQRNADGSWTVRLSADPQEGNWIPLGDVDGLITLSLRLYNPGTSIFEQPESIQLPRIIKED